MESKKNTAKEAGENAKNALIKPIKPYKVKSGQGRPPKGGWKPPVIPTHSEIISKQLLDSKITVKFLCTEVLEIDNAELKWRLEKNKWTKEMLQRLANENVIVWKSEEMLEEERVLAEKKIAGEEAIAKPRHSYVISAKLERGKTTEKALCELLDITQVTLNQRLKDNNWKKYMLKLLNDEHIIVWEDPDDKYLKTPSI